LVRHHDAPSNNGKGTAMADAADRSTTDRAAPVADDDPRVLLAAERTLLAWVRTGLAMMGFGFLVAKFGLFLREVAALHGDQLPETHRWSVWIGAALVVLGAAVNLVAGVEHLRLMRELGRLSKRFSAGYRMGIATALLLAAVGVMMVLRLLIL
jgi:putative membrane protein